MKKIVVLYHKDCPDGFGAAWAAWKKFGNKAEYIPIKPSQTSGQLGKMKTLKGKDIYFLDVCTSPKNLGELVRNNLSVTVIDHHGTNREIVRGASQWYFDMNHSASVLSWMYFHPQKPVPRLLRYIEDNDLWSFKLPYANEISAWLMLSPDKFDVWERLARNMEKSRLRRKYIEEGKLIVKYEDEIIKGTLGDAYEVKLKGRLARAVNTTFAHSQVANALIDKKHPIGIVWFEDGSVRKYSLRSKGSTDVARIARQFPGGGGHKHAAGFTLPANRRFPWKVIKRNGK